MDNLVKSLLRIRQPTYSLNFLYSSCSLDKTLILWDMETFKPIKILPVFESISAMVLKTPDLKLIGVENPEENGIYALTYGDKGYLHEL